MRKGDMRLVETVLQLATNRVFRAEAMCDGRLCKKVLASQTCCEFWNYQDSPTLQPRPQNLGYGTDMTTQSHLHAMDKLSNCNHEIWSTNFIRRGQSPEGALKLRLC